MYLFCWRTCSGPTAPAHGRGLQRAGRDARRTGDLEAARRPVDIGTASRDRRGRSQRCREQGAASPHQQFTLDQREQGHADACASGDAGTFDTPPPGDHQSSATACRKVRRALANVATYMIFDDHEVTDDWYLSPIWRDRVLTAPLGRTSCATACWPTRCARAGATTRSKFQADVTDASGTRARAAQAAARAIPQLFPHGEALPPARPPTRSTCCSAWTASRPAGHLALLRAGPEAPRAGARLPHAANVRVAHLRAPGNLSARRLADQLPGGPLPPQIDVLVVVSSLTVLGTPVIDELIGPMLFRLFGLSATATPGRDARARSRRDRGLAVRPERLRGAAQARWRRTAGRDPVGRRALRHQRGDELLEEGRRAPARFAQFISSGLQNPFGTWCAWPASTWRSCST